jgi:dTDP-glucose pyrophosphorylase
VTKRRPGARRQETNTPTTGEESVEPSDRWELTLLPAEATVREGIRNLEESTLQISLVVGPDGVLVGTLTDGDIRRGLLRGLDLNDSIDSIIHRDPVIVPPSLNRDTVTQLMKANNVRQLPVVDDGRHVVGLHLWNELLDPSARPNLMVIMAGGEGIRLRPRTEKCPKPLLPVGGKPMLEHIIERAKSEGFHKFVLAIRYLGEMIQDHFGDGSRWGIEINYLRENDPLGTAGAIGLLEPRPEAPFVVSNGDVLTDIRYGEMLDFHCRHAAAATMAVRMYEWEIPFGVVHTEGVEIVGFEEKPLSRSHINAGVYVLDPAVLDVLNVGAHCDMPTLFGRLKEIDRRTIVYPMHEPWLDVGRLDDYKSAQEGVWSRDP